MLQVGKQRIMIRKLEVCFGIHFTQQFLIVRTFKLLNCYRELKLPKKPSKFAHGAEECCPLKPKFNVHKKMQLSNYKLFSK